MLRTKQFIAVIGLALSGVILDGCACNSPVVHAEVTAHVTNATTGAPVLGASVTVTPASGGSPISLSELGNGDYASGPAGTAPTLPYEGDYTLNVSVTGYDPYTASVNLTHAYGGCYETRVVDATLTPH